MTSYWYKNQSLHMACLTKSLLKCRAPVMWEKCGKDKKKLYNYITFEIIIKLVRNLQYTVIIIVRIFNMFKMSKAWTRHKSVIDIWNMQWWKTTFLLTFITLNINRHFHVLKFITKSQINHIKITIDILTIKYAKKFTLV